MLGWRGAPHGSEGGEISSDCIKVALVPLLPCLRTVPPCRHAMLTQLLTGGSEQVVQNSARDDRWIELFLLS